MSDDLKIVGFPKVEVSPEEIVRQDGHHAEMTRAPAWMSELPLLAEIGVGSNWLSGWPFLTNAATMAG
jgi:hypothetical protein